MRLRRVVPLVAFLVAPVALVAACNDLLGTPDPTMRDASVGDVGAPLADAGGDSATEAGEGSSDASALADDGAPPLCCDDGGCAPVNATADNCGTCGHSCFGGACDAGRCGPVVLVGSQNEYHGLWSPYGLAIVGDSLYGTNWYGQEFIAYRASTSVYSAEFTRIFPAAADAGHAAASSIAADDSGVYFAINKDADSTWAPGVYAVNSQSDGGPINTTSGINYVAVDSSYLYWVVGDGTIGRANKDGSDATSFSAGATSQIVPSGGRLYYVSSVDGLRAADPADPSTALVTYSRATTVDSFAVGSSYVYWVDKSLGNVYRASLVNPGMPSQINSSTLTFMHTYVGILIDDQYVYLNDTDLAGTILSRCQLDGGGFEVMATLNDGVFPIVQDSTALYFASYGAGTDQGVSPFAALWKLAK